MSTITVKVNDQIKTITEHKVVTQDGKPTIIKAVDKINYELLDESTGHAPNHIITKRIDKDLHVSFEGDSENPDLIIEGFYDDIDSALLGMAEDGSYYYYIPDSGEVADYVTELETGDIQGQALGGNPQIAPWWIGATETEGFNALPWLVGLAGVGLLGAALGSSGSSNNNGSKPPVDTTAPDAPVAEINPEGTLITGSTEPGATVDVDINGDGVPDYTVAAGDDGNYEVDTSDTPLVDGETITVTATDKAGNESEPTDIVAEDTTAPDAPTAEINPEGTLITGSTEPGATVNVDINGDGIPDYTVTADDDGNYEVDTSDTPLVDGETITVTATDKAGNESEPTDIVAEDTTAPDAPTAEINPEGTLITGSTEPGATVNVDINGDGVPDYTVTADDDGNYKIDTSETPLVDGETITVTATDAAGNKSEPTDIVAEDTTAPGGQEGADQVAPVIAIPEAENGVNAEELANGIKTQVTLPTGTLEGDTITITVVPTGDGDPVEITHIVTGPEAIAGVAAVTIPNSPGGIIEDGDYSVFATVTDKASNSSAPSIPVDITVDTIAPGKPTSIVVGNGDEFLNAAEIDADGNVDVVIGLPANAVAGDTVVANGVEKVLTPADINAKEVTVKVPAPAEGESLDITASIKDVAGNKSEELTESVGVVDITAPTDPIDAPVITDNVANDGSGDVLDPAEMIASGGVTNDNTPSVIVPADQSG
ncbi:Ig-like domain-containing protein [Psychrobacter sp. DAB_AL43B]|uniref:Ig-like domain-containing protein n=1 Tax=Psychrobacter sp. DAB_AL43B TaxID=1028416 RepID=UPI0009A66368|nr:Ig-like domain-containing protein [Psychrobacter sp. DAB_AL43B]SLJ85273.1 hypothetical protein DABAL43B_2085 [Psychrobacter sp. DAB_AL43B]